MMQGEMGIQPGMVPTSIGTGIVQGYKEDAAGNQVPVSMVQVVISQPTGVTYVFFDPEAAIQTGLSLMETGKQARSGITVAKSLEGLPGLSMVDPKGNGRGH